MLAALKGMWAGAGQMLKGGNSFKLDKAPNLPKRLLKENDNL